jgi:hypothetical protein
MEFFGEWQCYNILKQITGRDPGFSQFTCYGVMLYWRLQLNIDVLEKQVSRIFFRIAP